MGEKLDIYMSYGQKLISLFVRLLFSRESYSLTELSRMLGCSKQTVLRLLNDITMAYNVNIDETMQGNRKYVSIKKPGRPTTPAPVTEKELQLLYMCRDFTAHLLGKNLFEEVTKALFKNQALLPEGCVCASNFAVYRPGSIDYTNHHSSICTLIEAMEKRKVCRITYQAILEEKPKSFYIKPLKIFSHHDTVYLHARKAKTPGKPYRTPDFDPLLAIHRVRKVELTERSFEPDEKYDFEKIYNRHFGIIKNGAFQVEVEFTGWAARYVSERVFSPDQKIIKKGKNRIRLIFTASSEPELISWVLSFADEARLIGPEWLMKKVKYAVKEMNDYY